MCNLARYILIYFKQKALSVTSENCVPAMLDKWEKCKSRNQLTKDCWIKIGVNWWIKE